MRVIFLSLSGARDVLRFVETPYIIEIYFFQDGTYTEKEILIIWMLSYVEILYYRVNYFYYFHTYYEKWNIALAYFFLQKCMHLEEEI